MTEPRPTYPGLTVDYGHGGEVDGVYQTLRSKQYTFTDIDPPLFIGEGIVNRQIAARLINMLVAARIPVYDCVADRVWTELVGWTQLAQADVKLETRVRRANEHPDHLFLSIHSNATGIRIRGPSQPARGASFYTSPGRTRSDPVATSLHEAFAVAFAAEPVSVRRGDFRDGDADHEANFYVLRKTHGTAVLAEVGFFTNIDDARYLLSKDGQHTIADAYYRGLAPWLISAPAPPPLGSNRPLAERLRDVFHDECRVGWEDRDERDRWEAVEREARTALAPDSL